MSEASEAELNDELAEPASKRHQVQTGNVQPCLVLQDETAANNDVRLAGNKNVEN